MSSEVLVSILIPSYNHAPYIAAAIDSALAQTHQNIEVIIVDDASTDGTRDILKLYEGNDRVQILFNDGNKGHNWSLNRAIEISRGEFISFLASDDWYLPEKTEIQLKKFSECGPEVGLIYGRGGRYFTSTGETVLTEVPKRRGDVFSELVEESFIYPITPLIRRACFERVKFNKNRRSDGESIYLWMALYFEFDFVTDLVATMRDHPGNLGKRHAEIYDALIVVFDELFALEDVPESVKLQRDKKFANIHRTKGMQFIFDSMDFSRGRRALFRAIDCDQGNLVRPKTLIALSIACLPGGLAKWVVRMIKLARPRRSRGPTGA